MKFNRYIRDRYILEFIVYVNRIPKNIPLSIKKGNIPLDSRWSISLYATKITHFEKLIHALKVEKISFYSTIKQKTSLLSALLNIKRGEEYTSFLTMHLFKWISIIIITVGIPAIAGNYTLKELDQKLNNIIYKHTDFNSNNYNETKY